MSCNASSNPRNDAPKNQQNFNNSWILAPKNKYDSTVIDKKRTNITNQNYNENATQYGISCTNNSLHRFWKLWLEKNYN